MDLLQSRLWAGTDFGDYGPERRRRNFLHLSIAMKVNAHTAIVGDTVVLVPYRYVCNSFQDFLLFVANTSTCRPLEQSMSRSVNGI